MISRVAESCFWLHRYIERADNVARLLRVNRSFVLDVTLPEATRWRPVVVVSGEQERFASLYSEESMDDGEQVQEYMTWNERNPSSLYSCVKWARENGRTIRETISIEMWENLNGFWRWISDRSARKLYDADRDAFYLRIRDAAALFLGVSRQTVLHDECFAFMQLGVMLERAGQTARILDVKHHTLAAVRPPDAAAGSRGETAIEAAHAMALLRSCSAIEPFYKRGARVPGGRPVVAFLYGESLFPRSVLHCLGQAGALLGEIRDKAGADIGVVSAERLSALVDSVRATANARRFDPSVHDELTRVIDETAEICVAIHSDYFDPSFEVIDRPTSQSQSQG